MLNQASDALTESAARSGKLSPRVAVRAAVESRVAVWPLQCEIQTLLCADKASSSSSGSGGSVRSTHGYLQW
ncbi:hypothetical protein AAFF_G00330030 [Aldrovandia affinis]|uniref:Uncharacterized protein n=1 Tax=Aldrovandia affinis TaxID=143900 RepID=A0AAD7SN27_9TELE|nr:hypothetical protein AAFF_G00330030 [Aldrovandia affinis]